MRPIQCAILFAAVFIKATADAAPADSGATDTSFTCHVPLPGDFYLYCGAPRLPKGGNPCRDSDIATFLDNCFKLGGDCPKWQREHVACNACALNWVKVGVPNAAACIASLNPGDVCATDQNCLQDCHQLVCVDCSYEFGSGRAGTTEHEDCIADVDSLGPSGLSVVCYKSRKKLDDAGCVTKFGVCFDNSTFFKGACRDNGDFTNADKPEKPSTRPDTGPADMGMDTSDVAPDTSHGDTRLADSGGSSSSSSSSDSSSGCGCEVPNSSSTSSTTIYSTLSLGLLGLLASRRRRTN